MKKQTVVILTALLTNFALLSIAPTAIADDRCMSRVGHTQQTINPGLKYLVDVWPVLADPDFQNTVFNFNLTRGSNVTVSLKCWNADRNVITFRQKYVLSMESPLISLKNPCDESKHEELNIISYSKDGAHLEMSIPNTRNGSYSIESDDGFFADVSNLEMDSSVTCP